jgi:glycosyltransferase involved in cell wall biosynthesis
MGTPDILYAVLARLYNLYRWFVRSIIVRFASRVIFLSRSYPESLRLSNKVKERIRIVRLGLDVQRFSPSSKGSKLKAEYGFNSSDKILLFVGVLDKSHRYKGVDYLIKAVHIARSKNATIKLVVVGGGELVSQLKQLAQELDLEQYVVFAGQVPNEHLPPYYAMCDILALPSITGGPESFPAVLGEAMAMGKPCIASDMPGVRDALRNGYTGLLTPPKDSQALAQAILRLAEDDTLRREMSHNARKEVESRSWQKCAEETEVIYNEVVRS